jgi:hypothetical protein
MKSLLFHKEKQWIPYPVYGSQVEIKNGIGSTLNDPHGCSSGWFAGKSTVILGANEIDDKKTVTKTEVSFAIPVDPVAIRNMEEGFLIIACERYFGGLHTKVYNSLVEIKINDQSRDLFGLKRIPPEHTDYFHRVPLLKIPKIWPISGCQTIYTWPVDKYQLLESGDQTVTLKIDEEVRWDIDYVVILLRTEVLRIKVPNWLQQLIYLIIGAVLGVIISRMFGG